MTFENDHILWLLLAFPPGMILFFWWAGKNRRKLWTQFIQSRLLPGLVVGISPARTRFRLGCLVVAVAGLIFALAGPQWGFDWETVVQRGLDIVVAVDTSKSMLAEDIPPNRLARAKLAALDLMQEAKSDRMGLVAFAGEAFLECPLTIDDSAFRQSVDSLDVNIIPEGGTALAEAINTALAAFKEGDNYKVLVLFSDGEDQEPGAVDAAKKAAEAGLRIFTVGIGSKDGELLRVTDAQGKSDYVRDGDGNVVKSHLNEDLLRQIATAANGFYLPLAGAKTIDTLYRQGLAPLPKSEAQEKLVRRYREIYRLPVTLAIVCLVVEMLFPETKRPAKARRRSAAAPAAVTAMLLLCALLAPAVAFGSAASALRDYRDGEFAHSEQEYQRLADRKGADPRLHFNAGAAAYRDGKYDDATNQFNQALTSPDPKLQELAYYNRGNSLFQLGDRETDTDKKIATWQQSVGDYQSTIKLNTNDADAKFNLSYVQKKLEELKQQQQQQQQQQNKQDQNQKQNQDQDKQQQDQQNKDNQQKDSQSQQQKQQQKDSQQKQDQQQQAKQDQDQKDKQDQQKQSGQKDQKDKKDQANQPKPANGSPQDKKDQNSQDQQQSAAYAAAQMTQEQAEQMLEAQKDKELLLPVSKIQKKSATRATPLHDW
jgi:Ca-activated chloride channel homolog